MASIVGDSVILANLIDGLVNGRRNRNPNAKKPKKAKPRRLGISGNLLAHHIDWTINQNFTSTNKSIIQGAYLTIARGDSDRERIGRAIKVSRFIFQGLIESPADNMYRLDIILDTSPQLDSEPTLAEIYETDIEPQNEVATALPNPHFAQRFKFLHSRTLVTNTVQELVPFNIDIPLNFTTTYESDSNKVISNKLYWVSRACDEKYSLNQMVSVVGSVRIVFND